MSELDERLVDVVDAALVGQVGGSSYRALSTVIAEAVWVWLEEGDDVDG